MITAVKKKVTTVLWSVTKVAEHHLAKTCTNSSAGGSDGAVEEASENFGSELSVDDERAGWWKSRERICSVIP